MGLRENFNSEKENLGSECLSVKGYDDAPPVLGGTVHAGREQARGNPAIPK